MPLDSSIYFPQQKKTTKRGLPKNALAHVFSPAMMTSSLTNNKKNTQKNKRHEDSSRFKTSNFQTPWSGLSLVWQVVLFQVHGSLAALDEIPEENTDSRWNKAIPLW